MPAEWQSPARLGIHQGLGWEALSAPRVSLLGFAGWALTPALSRPHPRWEEGVSGVVWQRLPSPGGESAAPRLSSSPLAQARHMNQPLAIDATHTVSSIAQSPPDPRAAMVLAHGAGAGMTHPFMAAIATGLGNRGIATLRFNFPYMERGGKRTDSPPVAQATVRAAVAEAGRLWPDVPLVAGGKSFGARMSSQAQAAEPLPRVRALVFFGFPLHPAGQPSSTRAEHLAGVQIPMLFLQGTSDKLADLTLLRPLVDQHSPRATLHVIEHADHSFHVPVRSGRSDAEVLAGMLDTVAGWISEVTRER